MSQPAQTEIEMKDVATFDPLASVREMVQSCIQCGTCTGSCPNAFAMDYTPRHMWRMVLMGQKDEIFRSKTFGLCSACYFCTLRCPRGLYLTEAMSALKRIGARENLPINKPSNLFYKNFMKIHQISVFIIFI